MDGILNILIIVGFIVFAILRQVLKPAEDKPQKPNPTVPYGMEESFPEITITPETTFRESVQTVNRPPKKHPTKTSNKTKPREVVSESPLQKNETVNSDIDTQSIEEIRKGIIWFEILNRKY
jgi:hypothetical protein